jgi:hypothetical protein
MRLRDCRADGQRSQRGHATLSAPDPTGGERIGRSDGYQADRYQPAAARRAVLGQARGRVGAALRGQAVDRAPAWRAGAPGRRRPGGGGPAPGRARGRLHGELPRSQHQLRGRVAGRRRDHAGAVPAERRRAAARAERQRGCPGHHYAGVPAEGTGCVRRGKHCARHRPGGRERRHGTPRGRSLR